MEGAMHTDDTEDAQGQSANKRKRTNVSKACEPCRRRRCKCDGVKPSCTTCSIYKDDCYWEQREDYRKPLSRHEVNVLTTRCMRAEALLRQHGIVIDQMDDGDTKRKQSEEVVEAQTSVATAGSGSGTPRPWSQDHLVEGESGDLQAYGPTSAFRHLGKFQSDNSDTGENRLCENYTTGFLLGGYARHLPPDIYLSQEQHDICIDRFFHYYASWGQRTNPILFRKEMYTALYTDHTGKTPHYSPLLHNAILAIALGFSDDPYLRAVSSRKIYAAHAKSFIDGEGERPSVATVQALAHLSSYHSLVAEHNLGWLYIGMALRCAVALGLNLDVPSILKKGNVSEAQARERNVTYWTIYIQEGLWAPYVGRSITLPEATALPPVIDVVLDELPWIPVGHGGITEDRYIQRQPGMISTTFVQTVKLMGIGETIMNTLYGLKADMSTLVRSGKIKEISTRLDEWLDSLPQPLRLELPHPANGLPHILMLHLSYAWLVILLHRPFYRSMATAPFISAKSRAKSKEGSLDVWAVHRCDEAASRVITLLQTWHDLHDLRYTPPTSLQCCFIAGTTHLLSLVGTLDSDQYGTKLDNVQQCIRLLGLMATSWPAARQKMTLLKNLLEDYGFSTTPVPVSGSGASESGPSRHATTILQPIPQGLWQGKSGTSSGIPSTDFGLAYPVSESRGGPPLQSFIVDSAIPSDNQTLPLNPFNASTSFDDFPLGPMWPFSNYGSDLDDETRHLLDSILQPHITVLDNGGHASHPPW